MDWATILSDLDDHGCATTGPLLTIKECTALVESYGSDELFRSRIVMAQHGFGRGEYKYFAYPLPQIVAALRDSLYPLLAQFANQWNKALGVDLTYPSTHAAYLRRCRADGQGKPTPPLLRYGPGDFNCLHQDLYGENIFPLQVAFLLSQPEQDFTGSEFVLTEQRPRMQSRAEVLRHRAMSDIRGPSLNSLKGREYLAQRRTRNGLSLLAAAALPTTQ